MIGETPRPLPDCALCGTPTRRQVHRRNNGMCSACRREYDSRPRAEQLAMLVEVEPPRRDLTNVVVLDTRRRK